MLYISTILIVCASIYAVYTMCRSIEKDTEKYKEEKNKVNKRNY
jgi:hypothetical protein